MCYRSDDEEQMEFIRKYNEKRAEMKVSKESCGE